MNKLQKFIVWLFRIPLTIKQEQKINFVTPEFKSNVEVLKIDDNADYIHEQLGVTEERFKELCAIADKYNGKLMIDCLIYLSKYCKHPNELTLMSYELGRSNEYYKNPLNKIIQ